MPSELDILRALRSVHAPGSDQDIASLGIAKVAGVRGGVVGVDLHLPPALAGEADRLRSEAEAAVKALDGVSHVQISVKEPGGPAPAAAPGARPAANAALSKVKQILAVASGKGGVGKSTVATNLALAMASHGLRVGLMDADIYGPSVPRMLGSSAVLTQGPEGVVPIEAFGMKVMSMGYLTGPDTPVVWRGPMATRMIQQFMGGVAWGELDLLVLDLPPGTGDVQLTIAQSAPLTGAIIVTTPQEVALSISSKGLKMFEQVNVPVLGIVENMAGLACPHCDEVIEVFPRGGVEKACREGAVAYLGSVPMDPAAASSGDKGVPVVADAPDSVAAKAFQALAGQVTAQLRAVREGGTGPTSVDLRDGGLAVEWADGTKQTVGGRALRLACPCASCLDEWTGEKILDDARVPADVVIDAVSPVGRYGHSLKFSDGHSTGIFTHEHLRGVASR